MIRNWRPRAKCLGDDPDKYVWEDGEYRDEVFERAAKLCVDCPVINECYFEATNDHNLTRMLRQARLKPDDAGEDVLFTRGVIRGGHAF